MGFLLDFLRQKAPGSGKDMPAYYRKALTTTAVLLIVYFLAGFLLLGLAAGAWEWVPLAAAACMGLVLSGIRLMGPRLAGLIESFVIEVWCVWCVHSFGWGSSVQQFLAAPLMLSFFNVSEKPRLKLWFLSSLVVLRLVLYAYSTHHAVVHQLGEHALLLLQIYNTVFLFSLVGCLCVLFSTSLQDTERQLRIDNQELSKEAGTDPLTQLPNRRAMMNEINAYLARHADEPFCVAIADIDFFKSVNDTSGHSCGDYTLRTLAGKFRELATDRYRVCRWGGEEFCFFMPGMNLDQASTAMHDACTAIKMMPLSFEGIKLSITITIGVAENDFHSPLQSILEEADRKLYMGKHNGRDQVVF